MKKRPTLRQVLAGYLLATGGLCLLAAAVWWGSFAAMVRAGVLWPADRMSELAYQAKTAVEAAGTLPPEALPDRCGYLLLDGGGELLSTNLTGRRLEAALDLGATPGYALTHVIIPEIRQGIITGAMLAFTLSLDDFTISYFTTSPMVQNLSTLIYSKARIGIDPTLNALSALMFVALLVLLIIVNRRTADNSQKA